MVNLSEYIGPIITAVVTAFLGWILGYKQRNVEVSKTQAEAKKIMSEARKALQEGDNEAAESLSLIVGAWQTLFDANNKELARVKQEVSLMRQEVANYRRGVDILIRQIESLGEEPQWKNGR